MGTRSTIAMVNEDGTVSQIYCHWDGYLKHNGDVLLKHYKNPTKINRLIKLGALSFLGKNTGKKIDFDGDRGDQCRAYHRDRGDELTISHFPNVTDYKLNGDMEGYDYLFIDGKWQVQLWGGNFIDLIAAIENEENEVE